MKTLTLYTDGACRGNPGVGGWGAILNFEGNIKELKGYQAETTNNQMELMAAIKGLESINQQCEVTLYTDSKYVLNGATDWLKGWKKNNWKTAAKKPVKNVELWQQLDTQLQRHTINWQWVKGHSNDPGNDRADELANIAIDENI